MNHKRHKGSDEQPIMTEEELAGVQACGGWIHRGVTHSARGRLGFPPKSDQGAAAATQYYRNFWMHWMMLLDSLENSTKFTKSAVHYFERLLVLGTRLHNEPVPEAAANFVAAMLLKSASPKDLNAWMAVWIRVKPQSKTKLCEGEDQEGPKNDPDALPDG